MSAGARDDSILRSGVDPARVAVHGAAEDDPVLVVSDPAADAVIAHRTLAQKEREQKQANKRLIRILIGTTANDCHSPSRREEADPCFHRTPCKWPLGWSPHSTRP